MNCDKTKEEIGYLKMFTTLMYATLVSLALWTVNFTMATFWISILALLILLAIIVILNISTYKLIKTL